MGYNFSDHKLFITSFNIGIRKIGSNSIIYDPYDYYTDYIKGPFPSGEVNKTSFFSGLFRCSWKNYLNIYADIEYFSSNILGNNYVVKFGLDIFYKNTT